MHNLGTRAASYLSTGAFVNRLHGTQQPMQSLDIGIEIKGDATVPHAVNAIITGILKVSVAVV
jgi:hypothetical protein